MAKKTKSDATTVEQIVNQYKSSWDYAASYWHTQWQDWYKLYNSDRIDVAYNGVSDTFVPISYSTIETLVSGTSGEKPVVEYIPTRYDQKEETEVLNAMFSYYWDLDNWTNKWIIHNRNFFLYGTAVAYVYWDIDHPVMQNISLRDFYIDPTVTAINYQDASFMGHRFLASLSSLKEAKIADPETGELVPKYKNLDKVSGSKTGDGEQTEKQEQDRLLGATVSGEAAEDQVEILCHWTLDKHYYVANREVIIYESDNLYKQRQQFLEYENPTGMYPYLLDPNSITESQLYGRSVLQPIAKPQELLNDLTNQNIDAASWALDPLMELDPQYQSYLDKIQNVPGAVMPFKPGSYQAVQKPMIPSAVFNERTNIKNEMREATAIDQVLRGVGAQGETTATEIKAQIASSGKRFDVVLSQMENGGYYKFAKIIFQLIQMYVTAPTMVRVIGREGVNWDQFDPEMFRGDYEPRVRLAQVVKEEKMRKMRNLKEMYTALLGSPFVNQLNLTRLVVKEAFDLEQDEVEPLVISEEELAKQSEGKDKAGAGEPKELINYKDAPPDIKMQMEEAAGYQPSEMHDGDMERQAMEQVLGPEKELADITQRLNAESEQQLGQL